MSYVLVTGTCHCCQTVGTFTTSPECSTNQSWIDDMVTTYCCLANDIEEFHTQEQVPHSVYDVQDEFADDFIPF